MLRYEIGNLNLLYACEEKVLVMNRTSCLNKFALSEKSQGDHPELSIRVLPFKDGFSPKAVGWENKIAGNEIWEFWEVDQEHFGLRNPMQRICREFIFTKDYRHGKLYGENFAVLPQDLEIVLFSNWLASFGDVILHASAILTEKGVTIFSGQSGVGKSTLVEHFSGIEGVDILGEDQVILRIIDGEIIVFGTPWHINPNFCSEKYGKLNEIIFLEKKGVNSRESLKAVTSAALLLKAGFIPFYRTELLSGIVERISSIAERIPASLFSYTLDVNPTKLFL
jgi:hypothetical protein